MFGLSCFALYKTGTEFIPATDEGYVTVEVDLPRGTSLEVTEQVVSEIEERINEESEVEALISLIGGDQQVAISRNIKFK